MHSTALKLDLKLLYFEDCISHEIGLLLKNFQHFIGECDDFESHRRQTFDVPGSSACSLAPRFLARSQRCESPVFRGEPDYKY